MKDLLKRFGLDGFIVMLFVAIFMAWLYPAPGAVKWHGFSLLDVAHWGVSVIFFLYGLRLNWSEIYSGLSNYKLHLVTQSGVFIIFPLVVLPLTYLFGRQPDGSISTLWLGIFFLSALPSTVSSSVVMVNLAKGNLPGAIFNASISSLLGVFITPLWMSIFVNAQSGAGRELHSIFISLIIQVIVPIVAGISLNRIWGTFAHTHKNFSNKFDQSVIILIVYSSYCSSFNEGQFATMSMPTLITLSAGMIALFFVAYFIMRIICLTLRFNREDTITALFCGSKKSLVHGAVMSQIILTDPAMAGILLLPTMLYHALQLIIVSILARRWARSEAVGNRQ